MSSNVRELSLYVASCSVLIAACVSPVAPRDAAVPDHVDAAAIDRSLPALSPRFEVVSLPALCDNEGWCWEHPSPVGGEIVALTSSSPDDGFALTRDGMLLHASGRGVTATRIRPYDPTHTEGTVWSPSPGVAWVATRDSVIRVSPDRVERVTFFEGLNEPTTVWGAASDDIWAAGTIGGVVHFDGTRWSSRNLPTSADVITLTGGGGEVWAWDGDGVIWRWRDDRWQRGERRTPDEFGAPWVLGNREAWSCARGLALRWNGTSWMREVVDRTPGSDRCVVWSDGNEVWYSDGVSARRRTDDGLWAFESETFLVSAVGGRPDNLWLGRSDGILQRFASARWYPVTSTRPRFDITRLVGDSDATLRAVTPTGLLAFDGRAWFPVVTAARYFETRGAWPDAADSTWLAGVVRVGERDRGRASRMQHNGTERDTLEAPAALNAIAARASEAWAVGDDGLSYRFDGSTWTRVATQLTTPLRDVWIAPDGTAWAVGDAAVALQWNGTAWMRSPLPVTANLTRVHGRSADDVWAVGTDPGDTRSLVLRWDGTQWRRDTAGLPAGYNARGVWAADDGSVWLAGSTALQRDARVWNVVPMGADVTLRAVWGARDGTVRMAGSTSAIFMRRAR
jgi:hypothetical protein